jgi:CelD/BcsL family acetyltransferase involved in cellulose biosynthesis
MSASLVTAIIRDAGEFAALEAQWWALFHRVPSATPFQSPAWLIPWWQAFAPGMLHVATVRRDGDLVGLAPFYLEGEGSAARLLPIGISVSDYLDVLLAPDCAALAAASLSTAMAESGDWQSWEMPELAGGAQAFALPCPAACQDSRESGPTCPFLALAPNAQEFRRQLPQRKRRSLAMNRNRAEKRGELNIRSLRDSDGRELLAELIRLHGICWESRGEPGVLADPQVRDFHRNALPRLAEAGLARLYALRIGGDTAAVYYGFLRGGDAYAYVSGFDPAFAHESPGTLLIAHAIEEAIAEGAREFHFLRGDEAYKYGWGAVDRWNQRRLIRRRAAHG